MVIAIVGPTCVGKTKLSVELAKRLNGEVINADSTQIYQGLNIATAKVTEEEKEGIPHHLFDLKTIHEEYSLYDYQTDCRRKIEQLLQQGKTPILVGGTGLYLKAALYNYELTEEEPMRPLTGTTEELYEALKKVDPNTKIDPHNRQRIERSLNYYHIHHQPMSEKRKATELLYPTLVIGLTTDRETLYQRINERVTKMSETGLLEEAWMIYDSHIRSKAVLTPIGYKELFPYFDGTCSLEEALDQIRLASRHYAKRQYTWFRNQMQVTWFSVNYEDFSKTVLEVFHWIQTKR